MRKRLVKMIFFYEIKWSEKSILGLEVIAKMATQQEKSPKISKNLSRPPVNYFKNSLRSLVIMLRTAPGVKLPSHRKNGFNASWWRCAT